MSEFKPFPKVARLFRDVVITEKIDGTNACVILEDDGSIAAQSRNRIITPEDDNFGFARWVAGNKNDLLKLGPGHHFGEWWGVGIQRGYHLSERRFSLFNVHRWGDDAVRPACCHVVPVLYRGSMDTGLVHDSMVHLLRNSGSFAAPGFMDPEGYVIFHNASGQLFKFTLGGDGHKGDGK